MYFIMDTNIRNNCVLFRGELYGEAAITLVVTSLTTNLSSTRREGLLTDVHYYTDRTVVRPCMVE